MEIIKRRKQVRVLGLAYLYFELGSEKQTKRKTRKTISKQRRWWVRDILLKRKDQGTFHSLLLEMRLSDTESYFNFLRMTPSQFDDLLAIVGPSIERMYHIREPINPAERLAVTLRYLATGDSMVSLSYAFRLGKQTVSDIIHDTCKAIWANLKGSVFEEPSEQNWLKIANEFETIWNFPHCVGAIDGKHVLIQAPPNAGSQFFNYKGSHSIVLLALCDAKYKFIAIDIGARGRQSDGGVLRHSELGRRLFNGQLNLPPASNIEDGGEPVPYFIVGDAAFPLTTKLMRPYPGNFLPLHKRVFNYRLSRARRVSENSFGILVSRWRILRKCIIASLETTENITKSAVAIHNWIMSNKEQDWKYCPPEYIDREDSSGKLIPGLWRNELCESNSLGRVGSNMYNSNAEEVRENLAYYFCFEGAVPFQWNK